MAARRQAAETIMKALDSLVATNSFLVVGVFVGGLTTDVAPAKYLSDLCTPGEYNIKSLFMLEAVAFFCFLASCSVAQATKVALTLLIAGGGGGGGEHGAGGGAGVPLLMRYARRLLICSAFASLCGMFFLILTIKDLVQLKFGVLDCVSITGKLTLTFSFVVGLGSLLFYGSLVLFSVCNFPDPF